MISLILVTPSLSEDGTGCILTIRITYSTCRFHLLRFISSSKDTRSYSAACLDISWLVYCLIASWACY